MVDIKYGIDNDKSTPYLSFKQSILNAINAPLKPTLAFSYFNRKRI